MATYGETICCDRCGQAIKNIYDFEGKQYGSECIETLLGFMPNQRNADKAVTQRDREQINAAAHIDRMNAIRAANQSYVDALTEAQGYDVFSANEFATSMIAALKTVPFSELSEKQQSAIEKICKRYR